MDIEILYEDEGIVAVNKPAGLVVHADGKTEEATLVDWVMDHYPTAANVGEPIVLKNGDVIQRPGIVHRIDRDTSGVLLIAKTGEAFEYLKKGFQERDINKTYHTFVYGEMVEDDGVIDRPIGRSKKDFRLWSAQRGARGAMRDAVTHYVVKVRTKQVSYVEVTPKTGRTHQIRVHFKAINHPIVCDPLYAPTREPLLGFNRTALHASSIEFTALSGEVVRVEAPLPEDFKRALAELKKGV